MGNSGIISTLWKSVAQNRDGPDNRGVDRLLRNRWVRLVARHWLLLRHCPNIPVSPGYGGLRAYVWPLRPYCPRASIQHLFLLIPRLYWIYIHILPEKPEFLYRQSVCLHWLWNRIILTMSEMIVDDIISCRNSYFHKIRFIWTKVAINPHLSLICGEFFRQKNQS